ncbi:MAG TPA: alpha/beta hydrolase [Steroidobacteraceae bacterium]
MTETPLFFQRDDVRLFCMLHAPEDAQPRNAFVLSHPFAEEKLWSHRVFVSLARALAQRGHVVLRFDYTGAGDSAGSTAEASMETYLADLSAALRVLAEKHPSVQSVGLIGLRLGATVCALFAERAAVNGEHAFLRGAPLILWEPVIDGEAYFQEILRSNLSTQLAVYGKVVENREKLQEKIRAGGVVNVDGYEVGRPLFESVAVPTLLPLSRKAHDGPALVVQVAPTAQTKERSDLQELARSYPAGSFARAVEQPFWREIKPFYGRAEDLQQVTLNWLEQRDVQR